MKNLFKWIKKYTIHLIVIVILLFLLEWLYSYLSQIVAFGVALINKEDLTHQGYIPQFFSNELIKANEANGIVFAIGMLSIMLILLQFTRSVLRFISNYMQGLVTQNIAYDMRGKFYNRVVDLSYSDMKRLDNGNLIQRATSDVDTTSNFLGTQLTSLVDTIFTVIVGTVRMSMISVEMMLVGLIIIPITVVSSILYYNYVTKLIDKMEEDEARMTTDIEENINCIRVVKAFANESYEINKMDKDNKAYCKADFKVNRVMSIYWAISDTITLTQYFVAVLIGIKLTKSGSITMSQMVACLGLLEMVVWPLRGLGRTVSNFSKAYVSSKRINEIINMPTDFDNNGTLKPEITGDIVFNNVSFKFDDDNKHLLNNVSFKINKGETVAIVGKTGSGKSTICNLLTRFLEIENGDILLNGVSIRNIDKKYLRQNIRMVLQDPFLYSKTLYENISIANASITKEKVDEVAKIADIYDEIKGFKNGYNTIVGEKGTTLSGGQKQRVAIARILTSNSSVLVFDDSLSALDTKTDLLIREALKKHNENQTMIIITHRITTAKEADKIIVLNNGTVEAIGTHEELKNNGLYSTLWDIQGKLEEEFLEVIKGSEK